MHTGQTDAFHNGLKSQWIRTIKSLRSRAIAFLPAVFVEPTTMMHLNNHSTTSQAQMAPKQVMRCLASWPRSLWVCGCPQPGRALAGGGGGSLGAREQPNPLPKSTPCSRKLQVGGGLVSKPRATKPRRQLLANLGSGCRWPGASYYPSPQNALVVLMIMLAMIHGTPPTSVWGCNLKIQTFLALS